MLEQNHALCAKKKGNNLITRELLLMTSSHKPWQKTYFLRKSLLTRSSDIRDKIFEISLRLTWLNLPWKKQFPTIYLYGLFDIKGIKIVLEYCHLKWL